MQLPEGANLDLFFGWVKVFVFQLLGKRQLEVLCRNGGPARGPVTISILAVDRATYQVPPWSECKEVIKKAIALDKSAFDSAGVCDALERRIRSCPPLHNSSAQHTVNIFRGLLHGRPKTYVGGTHCEAVLATLSQYHETAILNKEDKALIEICQVLCLIFIHVESLIDYHTKTLQNRAISVSKLCCPVCWELLRTMKEKLELPNQFTVRGCHSNIYPVVLPKWLPQDIIDKMVGIFRRHLAQELHKFVQPDTSYKMHRPRQESETNISVTSSEGGGETFVINREYYLSRLAHRRG